MVSADYGTVITVTITETNGVNPPASATSAPTSTVAGLAPTVPGVPTVGAATATGQTTATVMFTVPVSNGGATITSYTATSSPGGVIGTLTQAGSGTITVTGLTAGTAYTFTVTATNSVGTQSALAASNSVTTPTVPPPPAVVPTPPIVVVTTPPVASITRPVTGIARANEETVVFASIPTGDATTLPVSVTIPSGAVSTDVTVWIAPAVTASEAASGFVTIKVWATDSADLSITKFDKPLVVDLGKVATGTTAAYSQDGIVWTTIELLSGTTLPDGVQEGYYVSVDGSTMILTRHLTYFGVKIVQVPLMLTSSAVTLKGGESLTLTTSGGSGGGVVGFKTTTPQVCRVSSAGLVVAVFAGEGDCVVLATKAGTGTYLDAASSPLSITIFKTVPDAPIIGTATATGPNSATVTFTAPASNGGSEITSYTAFSSPIGLIGVLAKNGSGMIQITGLTSGTAYSFTVTATNSVGTSLASAASNSITPISKNISKKRPIGRLRVKKETSGTYVISVFSNVYKKEFRIEVEKNGYKKVIWHASIIIDGQVRFPIAWNMSGVKMTLKLDGKVLDSIKVS